MSSDRFTIRSDTLATCPSSLQHTTQDSKATHSVTEVHQRRPQHSATHSYVDRALWPYTPLSQQLMLKLFSLSPTCHTFSCNSSLDLCYNFPILIQQLPTLVWDDTLNFENLSLPSA